MFSLPSTLQPIFQEKLFEYWRKTHVINFQFTTICNNNAVGGRNPGAGAKIMTPV
jgi:hypothetical protein